MEELTDELSRLVQDTVNIMPDQCDYYEDRTILVVLTISSTDADKLVALDAACKAWLQKKRNEKLPVESISITSTFSIC